MALVSPGLSLTVTDESQYISNAVGTVPLVLLATAQDKTINGSIATGTTATNAGMLQVFGSQRELSTAMGYPVFQQSSAGTPLHGNELNEYGLMAAYSALGVTNQVYAIRANIDLNELQGTSVRPTQAVPSGTIWFDTADTSWGVFEWSQATQSFTQQTPIVVSTSTQVTSTSSLSAGVLGNISASNLNIPLQSVGSIGQYAVVTTDGYNRLYYKAGGSVSSTNINGIYNQWLLVGTPGWHASHPVTVGTTSSLTLPTTSNVLINGYTVQVTVGGSYTMANVVNAINGAAIPGVTADNVNGYLNIYSNGQSAGVTSGDGKVVIGTSWNGTGNTALISAVGISAGTYISPLLQANITSASPQPSVSNNINGYGTYTDVPTWTNTVSGDLNVPSGAVWLKTGSTGGGSNFVFKTYNSTTGLWNTLAVNSYPNQRTALYNLDPTGGGINIPAGTIFMHQDPNALTSTSYGYAGWNARIRTVTGAVSATGAAPSNPSSMFTSGTSFTMTVSVPGTVTTTSANIVLGGTSNTDFVTAVSSASLPNVTAQVNSNGSITLTHAAGGYISMVPNSGSFNVPAQAGFTSAITNVLVVGSGTTGSTTVTGFVPVSSYSIGTSAPVADPANGTLWYYSDPTQVDIMINTGTAWKGYQNVTSDARGYNLAQTDPGGVVVAAVAPTTQTDGTVLVAGDIWLNSSDLENWPNLSRWNGSAWVKINNADHVSVNGIIFADARWDNTGTNDVASGTQVSTQTLLTSNFVDLDAPNPLLYPRGMLLLNTRRSGYNVKKYVQNYFSTTNDNVPVYNSALSYTAGQIVQYGANVLYVCTTNAAPSVVPTNTAYWTPLQTSTWVTASGLNTSNNTPYAGHYAQRQIIVSAMKAALDSNTQVREDQFQFTLICAPGYPELISDMVSLNNDRANTAFVIGDTPLNLDTNIVDINNWSNDTNGNGLATNDPYLAVYYPGGLSTDLSGNSIMVPASHMALRTYLYNDNVAYPWFAPAGTRRGLVNNATDLGYVDFTTGEFVRTGVNQALRDSLYQLRINPITIIPGIGLVVWGQKTRDPVTESMDRVNVARLVNYIRTIFANAGNAFLFEPNDKITRDQFAAVLNRALNDLVAKRGIYDYLVVCDTTNNTPDIIANNQMFADVAIEPMKDVEFIYVPIRLFNPGEIASLGSK